MLYIVATPIGNLGDITLRALETLKNVDFILCEDTRVTKNLLAHYKIEKPLISYHQHTDARKTKEIIGLLESGKNLALVTDAGTPSISDPGAHSFLPLLGGGQATTPKNLVWWQGRGYSVVPIPGPSAVVAALSISSLPTDKFVFMGFPPHKNKRQKFFKEVAEAKHTVVFYESSHRIKKCLAELAQVLSPNRQVVICRELTKKFESVYRGTISEIASQTIPDKGEFVIVISPLYKGRTKDG
ncbi:16S rRNA (cytidine(1402)-2'-O)-methyltransferase [Patescibacteria group bacterium]|nr:MAG: 16S rRNA (cytidine(1402)-2'-O)-methyltransferase [Patescibacteria group bacterium]